MPNQCNVTLSLPVGKAPQTECCCQWCKCTALSHLWYEYFLTLSLHKHNYFSKVVSLLCKTFVNCVNCISCNIVHLY